MTKFKSVVISIVWSIIIIAFPVTSGVIVVMCKADAVTSKLIQTVFMCISILIPFIYCIIKNIKPRDIFIKRIDKSGVKACLFYIPLILVLLPMIVVGINLSDIKYVFITFLFTLSVGIAEEVYFRGIILECLTKTFGVFSTVFISSLIFGVGHIAGAFVESNPVAILLSIFNAFLFGWMAAEVALITKNIVPLMIFHCLFNFFGNLMLAVDEVKVIVFAVRGGLMVLVAVYLMTVLKKQSINTYTCSCSNR